MFDLCHMHIYDIIGINLSPASVLWSYIYIYIYIVLNTLGDYDSTRQFDYLINEMMGPS
jgi:hypothetical protein